MGIIPDDFELLLKKNDAILDDLASDLTKVKKSCSSLNANFNSADLKFMVSKLNLQLMQLDNIMNKANGYQKTLKNVYNGYIEQATQIVSDVKNLIS